MNDQLEPGDTGSVNVTGGELWFERFGPRSGIPILALHALTSHRQAWRRVIAEAPELDVVAVDLRGRGGSRGLGGPSSLRRHTEDVRQVAEAIQAQQVLVAGHSMGAAVALSLAVAEPGRVRGLVLVDGGLPLRDGAEPDGGALAAEPPDLSLVVGRLRHEYASAEEHREFWRRHPALGPYWNEAIEAYVAADLAGSPPSLRAGADPDRVAEDIGEVLATFESSEALDRARCPIITLRAERGLLDEASALYPAGWLQQLAAKRPWLEVREVSDTNHYTIMLGDRGAREVARALRELRHRVT